MQGQGRFRFGLRQRDGGINGTFQESCGGGNAVYSGIEKPLDRETKKGGEKVAGPVSVGEG